MRIRIDVSGVRKVYAWARSVVCCFREIFDSRLDWLGKEIFLTIGPDARVAEFDLKVERDCVFCVDVYCCGVIDNWPGVNHVQHGYFPRTTRKDGPKMHVVIECADGTMPPATPNMTRIMAEFLWYESRCQSDAKKRTQDWLDEVAHYKVGEALKIAGQGRLGRLCHIGTTLGPNPELPQSFFYGALRDVPPEQVWAAMEKWAAMVTETMADATGGVWGDVADPGRDFQWLSHMLCAYCHSVSYVPDHTLDMATDDDIFESVRLNRSGDCEDMTAYVISLAQALCAEIPRTHTVSPTLARLRAVALMYSPYVVLVTLSGDEFQNTGHVVPILVKQTNRDDMPGALLLEGTNLHGPLDTLEQRKLEALGANQYLAQCQAIMKNLPEVLLAPINRPPVGAEPKAPNFAAIASRGQHWYKTITEIISPSAQLVALGEDGTLGVPFVAFMNEDNPQKTIARFHARRAVAPPDLRAVSRPPRTDRAPWIMDMAACLHIVPRVAEARAFIESLPAAWLEGDFARDGGHITLVCGLWSLACNLDAVREAIGNLRAQYGNVCVRTHNVDLEVATATPVTRVSFIVDASVEKGTMETVSLAARSGRSAWGVIKHVVARSPEWISANHQHLLHRLSLAPVGDNSTLVSLVRSASPGKKMATFAAKSAVAPPAAHEAGVPELPHQQSSTKRRVFDGRPVRAASDTSLQTTDASLVAERAPGENTEATSKPSLSSRLDAILDEAEKKLLEMSIDDFVLMACYPSHANLALDACGRGPLRALVRKLAGHPADVQTRSLLGVVAALSQRMDTFRATDHLLWGRHNHVIAFVQNSAKAIQIDLTLPHLRTKIHVSSDVMDSALAEMQRILSPVSISEDDREQRIRENFAAAQSTVHLHAAYAAIADAEAARGVKVAGREGQASGAAEEPVFTGVEYRKRAQQLTAAAELFAAEEAELFEALRKHVARDARLEPYFKHPEAKFATNPGVDEEETLYKDLLATFSHNLQERPYDQTWLKKRLREALKRGPVLPVIRVFTYIAYKYVMTTRPEGDLEHVWNAIFLDNLSWLLVVYSKQVRLDKHLADDAKYVWGRLLYRVSNHDMAQKFKSPIGADDLLGGIAFWMRLSQREDIREALKFSPIEFESEAQAIAVFATDANLDGSALKKIFDQCSNPGFFADKWIHECLYDMENPPAPKTKTKKHPGGAARGGARFSVHEDRGVSYRQTIDNELNDELAIDRPRGDPQSFLDTVARLAGAAKDKAVEVWKYLVQRCKTIMHRIKEKSAQVWNTVKGVAAAWKRKFVESAFGKWLADVAEKAASYIKKFFNAVVEGVSELLKDIAAVLRDWNEINKRLLEADALHAL
jgi:hypothetical protein